MIFTDKKIADHHFNALHKNTEIKNKANMEETLDIDSDDDIISLDSAEENEVNPKNEFEKVEINLTQDEKEKNKLFCVLIFERVKSLCIPFDVVCVQRKNDTFVKMSKVFC